VVARRILVVSSHRVILNFEVLPHANVPSTTKKVPKDRAYRFLIGPTISDMKAKSIITNIIDKGPIQNMRK
jgi:hypothetical protein